MAAMAGALAVGIAIAGTLAYTNFSQSAQNRFWGISHPGVRLHDDYYGTRKGESNTFDGKIDVTEADKKVYVENQDADYVIVRVRLEEFYSAAGTDVIDHKFVQYTGLNQGGAGQHNTLDEAADTANKEGDGSRGWQLFFGGQKYYWPNALLESDAKYASYVSNEYEQDKYYTWSGTAFTDGTVDATTKADMGSHTKDDTIPWYSAGVKNAAGDAPDQKYAVGQTSNVSTTTPIVLLSAWTTAGSIPGDFWIFDDSDSDGWFYYGRLLPKGEATGLLLNKVKYLGPTHTENFEYTIDVKMQAASPDQVYAFGIASTATSNDTTTITAGNGGGGWSTGAKAMVVELLSTYATGKFLSWTEGSGYNSTDPTTAP